MKSVVMFFMLLIIGAIGGLAATELKSEIFDNDSIDTYDKSQTNSIDNDTVNKLSAFESNINDLKEIIEEKDAELHRLVNKLSYQDNKIVESSDNETNSEPDKSLQLQINELKGLMKAMQQQIENSVKDTVKKVESEKEAKKKAQMKEQLKKIAEDMRKRQLQVAEKHSEKLRTELDLTDSQYQGIRAALIARSDKMSELMSNIDENNMNSPLDFSSKMEEIQKEWEETARNTLSPYQYEIFKKKKFNRVNDFMFMESELTEEYKSPNGSEHK